MEFVTDREIYEKVIQNAVPSARSFLWIGTSDMKDLYVEKGKKFVPFLEILSDLVKDGVAIRIIHAKEPGPAFRYDFDKYPSLIEGVEQLICPRVHFKTVVVDGRFAYSGSANLTGAGMGSKGDNKRNFESGIVTTDLPLVKRIMEQFDSVWMGAHCEKCQRKDYCFEYSDLGAK
ncbi:MAG: phospholipase D-like domain-containing protein [Candidatus Eremiobacteraeota bacterium]|nr:phospholipase D-like domain-containing protein [Candidatus Eremiobacteraeota bacterium]